MDADEKALRAIQQQYEHQLILPHQKPPKQFVLCPVGLIGAGKTTVLKPLAQKLSLLRVSTDDIRTLLSKNGYNWDRATELALRVIEKYLDLGYSIAIDSDCASKPEKIRTLAKRIGIRDIWIHIEAPEACILDRLRKRQRTQLFKDADDAIQNYFARKPLHRELQFPFVFTFDTSRENLAEQIAEAARIIKNNTAP